MIGDDAARQHLSADLVRVAGGDREAFRRVYAQTAGKLFGVCLRVLSDANASEDVLQEVYVSVWRQAAQFEPARASPITWLCAIARNRAIDHKRAHHRTAERFGAAMPANVRDQAVAVDDALVSAERERRAVDCIDRLADPQRGAIKDAFLGGFTYLQIAERDQVPLGTMKSWIRRGLLEIRRCMADA